VDEAEQLIRQFIVKLKEHGSQEIHVKRGFIQLFSTIQHEILQSCIHPQELFASRNMIEELNEIREAEGMVQWIQYQVIIPYVQKLDGRMDMVMKQLVDQVSEYIDKHYMEDTSLEQCAEMVDTNPYLLSKAFKKVLNLNYIDYLTNVRITKAKELLRNTDLKISEISEMVGYRFSYFNRIFKKHVGITASEYRKKEQAKK